MAGIKIMDGDGRVENDMGKYFPSLVSVIVPVYNVEKYLYRCVDSIRNQTHTDLEIILVDDGSTDRSGVLCDEMAKADPRIRVVHKKNGGLSSARNVGMAASTGAYVGFVDSDDWIAQDTYEYLLKLVGDNGAEIAEINCRNATEFTIDPGKGDERIKILKDKDILQNYMTAITTTGVCSVCSCIFQRGLLKELSFREGKINEDIDFKYKALQQCKVYVKSSLVKYFYFQSVGSTTTSGLRKRDFDLYDAAAELRHLTCRETYGTICFLGEVKEKRTAFSLLCKIAYYGISDSSIERKEIIRELTKEHRKNLPVLLKAPLPLSRKVAAVLLAIHVKVLEILLAAVKKTRIVHI